MQVEVKRNCVFCVGDEDLSTIASVQKVKLDELKCLNDLENVYRGQKIILPKSYNICYVVKPLDSIFSIAQKLNISEKIVDLALNGRKIFIGEKLFF